ncbi:cation/multidrug efflux pump [Microbulbifer discodermiae]|uniref:cation/multidrug efflux pump n=1 Tax=Microbulbifer sp. 2201CG32-9 TaxID=3232309 RepID=UPI00345BF2DC
MYIAIALLVAMLALLLVFWGGRVLVGGSWLFGFIRGAIGLALCGAALMVVLVAADIYSYRNLAKEQSVGTLSFREIDPQHFLTKFADEDGLIREVELRGDQWQLDARILKWKGPLARWGIQPAYRLDRISGRYLTLQDERVKQRTVHQLQGSNYGVDVWQFLRQAGDGLPFVDTVYGSATFVPMRDGAVYDVRISHAGLLARPLNQQAESALEAWQ